MRPKEALTAREERAQSGQSKSILAQIREKEALVQKANKSVKAKILDIEKLAVNDAEMIEL